MGYKALLVALGCLVGATAAADTCNMLPKNVCWNNSEHKFISYPDVGSDPQICCQLCANQTKCASWNHGSFNSKKGTYSCDLYFNNGSTKNTTDGCSGGFRHGPMPTPPPRGDTPNIVFLVVESTDGRTWQRGYSNDAIPLPSIRELQENGVAFHRHYANAPVCCPSRATFWSGRHAHKIPHSSAIPGGPTVQGAWNNYEGLPKNFDQRIDQVSSHNNHSIISSLVVCL